MFDRRDKARETMLCAKLFRTSKPKIITNLTAARTAPFSKGQQVLRALRSAFQITHEVIDVGAMKFQRIYDLLGPMERAACIVSIDTATLHLAMAVDVPLVALLNDAVWVGSVPRFSEASMKYSQASPERIVAEVRNIVGNGDGTISRRQTLAALATMPTNPNRIALPNVTLWACCWSADKERQLKTLRVLRYCQTLFRFGRTLLFTYLPLPCRVGFQLEAIQIPKLDMAGWSIFHTRIIPQFINGGAGEYAFSVHDDGFVLDAKLWREEFLKYDFLGAPWADNVVGNGGFCIESTRFLRAKQSLPFDPLQGYPKITSLPDSDGRKIANSDAFTCRVHRERLIADGIRFAPTEVAVEFSTEQTGHAFGSFGFHGRRDQPDKYAKGWKLIEESERFNEKVSDRQANNP